MTVICAPSYVIFLFHLTKLFRSHGTRNILGGFYRCRSSGTILMVKRFRVLRNIMLVSPYIWKHYVFLSKFFTLAFNTLNIRKNLSNIHRFSWLFFDFDQNNHRPYNTCIVVSSIFDCLFSWISLKKSVKFLSEFVKLMTVLLKLLLPLVKSIIKIKNVSFKKYF